MSSPHDPTAPGEPPQPGYGQPPAPGYGYPADPYSADGSGGSYPGGAHPADAHPAGGYPVDAYSAGGYPADAYSAGGYPAGWYPPAGYQQWPAAPQPARPPKPSALVVAGVLWLVEGALLLVAGTLTAIADRLPGFEEAMRDSGETITHEQLLTAGISGVVFGVAIGGFGVAVLLTGATWARALVVVSAAVPTLLLLVFVLPLVLTGTATVLQFLPAVNRWVRPPAGPTGPWSAGL